MPCPPPWAPCSPGHHTHVCPHHPSVPGAQAWLPGHTQDTAGSLNSLSPGSHRPQVHIVLGLPVVPTRAHRGLHWGQQTQQAAGSPQAAPRARAPSGHVTGLGLTLLIQFPELWSLLSPPSPQALSSWLLHTAISGLTSPSSSKKQECLHSLGQEHHLSVSLHSLTAHFPQHQRDFVLSFLEIYLTGDVRNYSDGPFPRGEHLIMSTLRL